MTGTDKHSSEPEAHCAPEHLRSDGHAVVIGASLAGLLAARVLASHFKRVTVIERDRLIESTEPRRGVPQGRHVHALLARGQDIISEFFPNLGNTLIEHGALPFTFADLRWYHFGVWKKRFASALTGVAATRPFLEYEVRTALRAFRNVNIVDETVVSRFLSDPQRVRLTGVRVRARGQDEPEREIHADVVVDASGRGSQTPQRLAELGYLKPEEAFVKSDRIYATRLYERPAHIRDWKNLFVMERPPARRSGLILSVEHNRWLTTLIGWHGDPAPTDESGFLEFARALPVPDMHAALESARPLSEIIRFGFPGSQRRYYERLSRFPIGLIVLGDALCSFNPVYGQGMTVAALEAKLLQDCLRERPPRPGVSPAALTSEFRRRAGSVVDLPWQMSTGEDLRFPETPGHRSLKVRFMHWYLAKLHEAAGSSERITDRFYHVLNMLEPASTLFSVGVLREMLRVGWTRGISLGPPPSWTRLRG
jgi:2-polyprenyl-6-methoxyphenol hydroxylase-like FAD-dependent oxidoreductase